MRNLLLKTLLLGIFVFNAQTSFAQEEDKDLLNYQSRDWMVQEIEVHEMWNEPACAARTMGDDQQSILEVVAFKDSQGNYTEPMVQVFGPMNEIFFTVTAETRRSSEVFDLLPVYPEQAQSDYVSAVAQFDDREALINAIAQKNTLTAMYFDAQGMVKDVTFSLRGSSNAVNKLFSECATEMMEEELIQD